VLSTTSVADLHVMRCQLATFLSEGEAVTRANEVCPDFDWKLILGALKAAGFVAFLGEETETGHE
jgi:hypothetical protein